MSLSLPIVTKGWVVSGTYSVKVQAIDSSGAEAAFSTVCTFTIDGAAPSAPLIDPKSTVDPNGWLLGAAQTVPVTSKSTDVVAYRWAVDDSVPTSAAVAASAKNRSATLSIPVTETIGYGAHTLYVWAYDKAGNVSNSATLLFLVKAVDPATWSIWNVEQPDGLTVPDDGPTASGRAMTLTSNALRAANGTWISTDGKVIHHDEVLDFTSATSKDRATASPALAKGKNFTFSAWLDPSFSGQGNSARTMTALSYGPAADPSTAWAHLVVDAKHHYFFSVYDTVSKSMKTVTTTTTDDGSSGLVLVAGSYLANPKPAPGSPTTGELSIMEFDPANPSASEVTEQSATSARPAAPAMTSGQLQVGNSTWTPLAQQGWRGRIDQINVAQGWFGASDLTTLASQVTGRDWLP